MASEKYSTQEINDMRQAGLEKPSDLTSTQWAGPAKLSNLHRFICYLAATGMRQGNIAKEVGYTESRISIILNSQIAKDEIKNIQSEIFGKNAQKRFESLINPAIDVVEGIMTNKTTKDKTKLDAAFGIMDRAMGKPTQKIESTHNYTIKAVYDKLDLVIKQNGNEIGSRIKKEYEEIMEADYRTIEEGEEKPSQESSPDDKKQENEMEKIDNFLDMYGEEERF